MRDMKQRHSQNAGAEIARKETAAPKCRGGNCEKRKLWHNVVGGGKCGTRLHGQPKDYDFSKFQLYCWLIAR